MSELLRLKQFASALSISQSTARAYLVRGTVDHVRVGPPIKRRRNGAIEDISPIRIPASEVERMLRFVPRRGRR